MTRSVAATVALALAGLVLAVALAVLASRLSTQHIGLSGEPGASRGLAVPVVTRTVPGRARTAPRTVTVPPAPAPPRRGGEDSGGDD